MNREQRLNIADKAIFSLLLIISLAPLLFSRYYLTLDGPAHLYSGNIIKELILGNYSEYSNIFKFNQFPVPNWIAHFIFALSGIVFPDFIGEKIVIGIYLILFPLFFRRIILWFYPENKTISYFGILLSHNHLLYFGFYNFILAVAFFMVTSYYILKLNYKNTFKYVSILSILFLITYFSHVLVLLVSFAFAIPLALSEIKIQKQENYYIFNNWKQVLTKLKLVLLAMIPSAALAIFYILKVDSLEHAGHLSLNRLIDWIIDIRPMLALCMCKPWNIYTHILFGVIILMITTSLVRFIKMNCSVKDGKLSVVIPAPKLSSFLFLFFFIFLLLFLIIPNSNLLTERLILFVYIFLVFWLGSLSYPRWLHVLFLATLLTTHIKFAFMYTENMRNASKQIEMMSEITDHVPPGSLLLPFNYANQHNWLHDHVAGYFGSDKPIIVIENYEAQLAWFPLKWNIDGPYNLDKINVWGANNRKLTDDFYTKPKEQMNFSLPLKNGERRTIPYVAIFGKVTNEQDENYQKIISVLNTGYSLHYENDFCKLYKLKQIIW